MVRGLALGMKLALWNGNLSTQNKKRKHTGGAHRAGLKPFYLGVVQIFHDVISVLFLLQPHDCIKD